MVILLVNREKMPQKAVGACFSRSKKARILLYLNMLCCKSMSLSAPLAKRPRNKKIKYKYHNESPMEISTSYTGNKGSS